MSFLLPNSIFPICSSLPQGRRFLYGSIFGVIAQQDELNFMRVTGEREHPEDAEGAVILDSFEVSSKNSASRTKWVHVLQCYEEDTI